MREHIPDEIIERAVELWCRLLKAPRFDNGDPGSGLASFMAEGAASRDAGKTGDFDAAVERFRTALVERLKFLRDHEGEKTGEKEYVGHPGERDTIYLFPSWIGSDYGPDATLRWAADKAGVPHTAFSWKTDVHMGPRWVRGKVGYTAPDRYHYPLPDGRWLITGISAREGEEDFAKVIEAVIDGRLDLEVEYPRPAPSASSGSSPTPA